VSAVETLLFRARRSVREQLEGSLTCAQAEQAISRRLDGSLPRAERGALRAHLRQCEECAHLARSVRAQRGAIRSLAAIPLPGALAWSKFGTGTAVSSVAGASAGTVATGGAWVAGSVVSKVAVAALLATITAGAGYEAAVNHPWTADSHAARVRIGGGATRQPVSARQPPGQPASPAAPSGSSGARRQAIQVRETAAKAAAVAASASGGTPAPNAAASRGLTVPSANSHTTGSSHGGTAVGRSQGRAHATQPKLATHPTHPTHPIHPTKPTHPTHPTHPAKPTTTKHGTGSASTTTTTTTTSTPGHHRPSPPA
jgi:hypothetical protein